MKAPAVNQEKILIITESLKFQQELRAALSNYLVIAVNNADQAIEKLTNTKDYAAILVGIYLEKTNGIKLLKYIQTNPEFYRGPVLVLTDGVNDEVINKLKGYNVFDYIIRYSNDIFIQTTVRNAVVYYTEKSKIIDYTVNQVFESFNDMKLLVALLAQIVETKSFDAGLHVEHVGMITRILCKKLIENYNNKYKLDFGDVYYMSLASSLHDIGKIYIPDHILNKPDKLNPEEMKIMQEHSTLGAGIISRLPNHNERKLFKHAHDICLYHHERYDGLGYPKGLKADEIPISAQIVSLADCYDALTSDRVYRKAYDHETAMSLIAQGSCGVFNPDLLSCLWDCSDEIKLAKISRTSSKISKEAFYNIISDVLKIK